LGRRRGPHLGGELTSQKKKEKEQILRERGRLVVLEKDKRPSMVISTGKRLLKRPVRIKPGGGPEGEKRSWGRKGATGTFPSEP